jgi:hypothetical protein
VVRGQQALDPGLSQHGAEDLGGDVAIEQAVAVLGEGRVIPGRIIDPEPDEPPEEEIVLEALHQLSFRADGIKGLQEHGPDELLGRDGEPANAGVESSKLVLQR